MLLRDNILIHKWFFWVIYCYSRYSPLIAHNYFYYPDSSPILLIGTSTRNAANVIRLKVLHNNLTPGSAIAKVARK